MDKKNVAITNDSQHCVCALLFVLLFLEAAKTYENVVTRAMLAGFPNKMGFRNPSDRKKKTTKSIFAMTFLSEEFVD